jgi:hypothetical protein
MGNPSGPSTVSAQTAYSTSSVTGTYSLILSGPSLLYPEGVSGRPVVDFPHYIGSFTADGNGNIRGNLTQYGLLENNRPCNDSLSGSYSIQSNATGTMALSVRPTGPNECRRPFDIGFGVQAGQQGDSLLISESDGTAHQLLGGTAVKQ